MVPMRDRSLILSYVPVIPPGLLADKREFWGRKMDTLRSRGWILTPQRTPEQQLQFPGPVAWSYTWCLDRDGSCGKHHSHLEVSQLYRTLTSRPWTYIYFYRSSTGWCSAFLKWETSLFVLLYFVNDLCNCRIILDQNCNHSKARNSVFLAQIPRLWKFKKRLETE